MVFRNSIDCNVDDRQYAQSTCPEPGVKNFHWGSMTRACLINCLMAHVAISVSRSIDPKSHCWSLWHSRPSLSATRWGCSHPKTRGGRLPTYTKSTTQITFQKTRPKAWPLLGRGNSVLHIVKFSLWKHTLQWFLGLSHCCATVNAV